MNSYSYDICGGEAANIGIVTVNNVTKAGIGLWLTNSTFYGTPGVAPTNTQNLTITNTGTTTLNWVWTRDPLAGSGTWCKLKDSAGVDIPLGTGGSLSSGSSVVTEVAATALFSAGSFTDCGIRITDINAYNSPQNVSLTYNVSNACTIETFESKY